MSLKNDLDFITDTFTGADGGIGFVKFKTLLGNLQKQANDGDKASKEILKVVERFARLIKIAEEG